MKFGHFDDAAREYVITTPQTPYPWINYLGNDGFFGLMSNTGGGYCFYKDANMRRLTRYRYNNVPVDDGGRYYYIVDGDNIWNPGWKPMKTELDTYECRHGLGYTTLVGEKAGLRSELTCFVPLNATCEVHRMRLENTSSETKKIKLFSLVEWCLWNASEDAANFQRNFSTGEVEIDGSVIYHKTEYRERRNHFAFSSVNRPTQGYDTDRESFLGLYNGFHEPQVVLAGKPSNSVASGWSPIASHYIEIELAPGASDELVYSTGYAENPEADKWEAPGIINKTPAQVLIERFDSSEKVASALADLSAYWDSLLGKFAVSSGDEKLDRMVNIWNPYQCMVTFNFSRSASFFESGTGRGMGFRDSNQDLLGFVHQIPERAKERILDIAATQLADGGAYHQYQPLTKRGNAALGDNFNDDPLWLVLAVSAYIKETGDSSILEEVVPYENDDSLAQPLLDHLWRSIRFTMNNQGPHGLPLIGRADWNDCLNLNCFSMNPDEGFQTAGQKGGKVAESLMIAGLFCTAADEFSALLTHLGQDAESKEVEALAETMRAAVNEHGRDQAWFLRAYDAESKKVGSAENTEGQIFIESQGWCIMGGIGLDDGFAQKTLESVKERLDSKHGIMLQQPAYQSYDKALGEISSYPPGYKENAGIFCHNNPWIIIAETKVGNADRAWDYYTKICPAWTEEHSDVHRTEPYVYSQMIAGQDAVLHGEAKNSWLTGTAAWNFVTVSQHILGIRTEHNGLRVDPVLPAHLNELTITRIARGITFTITITRGDSTQLRVHGEAVDGTLIPWPSNETAVAVEAVVK